MQSANKTPTTVKPVLYPAVEQLLNELSDKGGKPLFKLSPQEARAVHNDLQSGPITKMSADIKDYILPIGPKGKVSIRIVRPKDGSEDLPVVMYFHGGGWVLGNKETHDRLIMKSPTAPTQPSYSSILLFRLKDNTRCLLRKLMQLLNG